MKTITLCSSMAFYKDALIFGEKLEKAGFRVLYPDSLLEMKRLNDFNPDHFKEKNTPKQKANLIKLHFSKVVVSDAILVVNKTKNGTRGYIGGNVLMEIGIAFNANKKIYLLHPVSKKLKFYEEIVAMSPTILKGKLENLK